MIPAIVVLAGLLGAVNGANDVPKAVATLAGAGVTRYRTAIAWGTLATFVGSVASITLAERLSRLFSSGIVDIEPTRAFTVAVLAGVAICVGFATVLRLPVSTTHAIVGALVGAGLVASPGATRWASLGGKVAIPMILSVGVAFVISSLVNTGAARRFECVCVEPSTSLGFLGSAPLRVTIGTASECEIHRRAPNRARALHWASSGAASFARGLNDTPKIAAIAAFALIPAGWSTPSIALLVGGAMALGALVVGKRVARRLAEDVVRVGEHEGLRANLVLATLVGVGANQGLPMSTTHVSTGAIAGVSGGRLARLNRSTLASFGLAWVATLPLAAVVAATVLFALHHLGIA